MMKMNPATDETPIREATGERPRLALAIATVFGVGYLPKAPGTFGSLVGIVAAVLSHPVSWLMIFMVVFSLGGLGIDVPMLKGQAAPFLLLLPSVAAFLVVGLAGVWSGSLVSRYTGFEDPQYVVIDEVSGQHLALLLALIPVTRPLLGEHTDANWYISYFAMSLLNWKFLILGFILFRVFDIWKPWPIRRLEKLPGGWGIMADDWMAGIYAAILLRVALHFNLV